jgi:hypothetical protein
VDARLGRVNFQGQLSDRFEKRRAPFRVQSAHAPQVAGKMASGHKFCEHRLFQDWGGKIHHTTTQYDNNHKAPVLDNLFIVSETGALLAV